jgi:pimeloyl-ACP methyl ester carboxylesterase
MVEQSVERFESADGTQIAAWRGGSGPPLVLVHGTSADHTRFAPVLPALCEHFTVHAVDRRGRGESGDSEPYEMEREFEDVAAVVDGLDEPASLLGHSYGAGASIEAARIASNLRRLVLYEPPLPVGIEIYPPGTIGQLEDMLADGDRDGVVQTFMREVVRLPPHDLELLRSLPSWQARVEAAHTIPREMRIAETYEHDLRQRFANLDVPTLLLLGGESPPFLSEPTKLLAQVLPNANLVVMDGQSHVAIDSAPEVFVRHVTDFLLPGA